MVPVSFGTDADGGVWTVKVATATFGTQKQVSWQWDDGEFGSSPVRDAAFITTVVDNHRTYVLAQLPRAVAPTARLEIDRDGMDPVFVDFADTDTTSDRTFAAYAFSEPVHYTAQVVGADGAVLATWPQS
jgi:hypothetical protein